MKSTKRSLLLSVLSLMLCITMLLGTTYAWFTDSVTSGKNTIKAGNLDVELTHTNAIVTTPESVQDSTDLFKFEKDGNSYKEVLWEPGMVVYENFTVSNVGNLALKYALSLNVFDKNTYNGNDLTEVIKVATYKGKLTANTRDALLATEGLSAFTTLADFQKTGNLVGKNGATVASDTYGVVLYWEPTDHDNDFNVNNGGHTSDNEPLFVEFGVNLVATQATVEADSFDEYYDKNATFPNIPTIGTKASATVDVPEDKANGMTIKNDLATLEIPAANIDGDASKYRLDIERIKNIEAGEDVVTLSSEGDTLVTYNVSLVKITASEEAPVTGAAPSEYTVTLYVGKHCDLVKLYHKGAMIANFTYNSASGEVKYRTNSFSPYAAEIKFAGGEGTENYPYLLANRVQFEALTTMYSEDYKYYAVDRTSKEWSRIDASGNPHMDGSNWKLISAASNRQRSATDFYGYLDCQGLVVDNLDCTLFKHLGVWDPTENHEKGITTVKNLTVNRISDNGSTFGDYDYSAGIARDCGNWIELDNVNVHGTIEGSSAASFIDFGAGNMNSTNKAARIFHIDFNNCYSDATVCGTSGAAAGFMVNTYAANPSCENGIVYTVRDSVFDGILLSTQNHATNYDIGENYSVNAGSYFANNPQGEGSGNDQVVKFCYSDAFLAKYGNDFVGKQYVCQATKHSGTDWGADIADETVNGTQYTTYTYKCHHSVSSVFCYTAKDEGGNYKYGKYNVKSGTNPGALGDVFTLSGCESDHAIAYYYYAVNPGCITYVASSEKLSNNEGTYTTQNVKYAKFELASSGTEGLSDDGKTYTVVNNGATEIASVSVKLVEYDANNNVLGITTWNITNAQ